MYWPFNGQTTMAYKKEVMQPHCVSVLDVMILLFKRATEELYGEITKALL